MKTPTARQFQYEKPYCLIEHDDCVNCFISIDKDYKGCGRCNKCKVAFEKLKSKSTNETYNKDFCGDGK